MPNATSPVLAGIRVVEIAHLIAGPSATMIMRELGAEVIKIESSAGDRSRALSRKGIFEAYNRGKQSVVLDLKSTEGHKAAVHLIGSADVLVEGTVPGTMTRLGLSYADLAARNPRLIYASVSAFNAQGPDAGRGGLDAVIQAESGIMSITGPEEGMPTKVGCQVVDAATGLALAQAVMAALYQRERTGRGQAIATSLFDVSLFLQAGAFRDYFISGQEQGRIGNSTGFGYPTDVFDCADGYIQVTAYFEDRWRKLCDVLGLPELAEDSRFSTNAARLKNRGVLRQILAARFITRPKGEWLEELVAVGIPAGNVREYGEIVAHLGDTPANPFGGLEGDAHAVVRLPYTASGLGMRHVTDRPPALGSTRKD